MSFPVIETRRLLLREIAPGDAADLFAIHGDPVLMRWFGCDPLPDLAAARKLVDTFAGWRQLANPGTRWALLTAPSPLARIRSVCRPLQREAGLPRSPFAALKSS